MFSKFFSASKFRSDFLWIVISRGLTIITSLFVMKVIALYFTPEIYGRFNLSLNLVVLANGILLSPILQSSLTYVSRYRHRPFVYAFFNLVLFRAYLATAVVLIGISAWYVGEAIITLCMLIYLAFLTTKTYGVQIFHITGDQRRSSIIEIVFYLAEIGAIIAVVLLVGWRGPLLLWLVFIAAVGSSALLSALFLARTSLPFRFSFHVARLKYRALMRRLFRFASPMTLHWGLAWLVNVSDRYIIEYYYGMSEAGMYAAVYGLASKAFLIIAGIYTLLLRPRIFAARDRGDHGMLTKILGYFLSAHALVVFGILSLLYFFGEQVGELLLSPMYAPAFPLIWIIAAGYAILPVIHFLDNNFFSMENSRAVVTYMAVGAMFNVTANLLLIPRIGMKGAAITTTATFAVQLMVAIFSSRRLNAFRRDAT